MNSICFWNRFYKITLVLRLVCRLTLKVIMSCGWYYYILGNVLGQEICMIWVQHVLLQVLYFISMLPISSFL